MTHLGTTLKHMYNYEYGLNKHRHKYKIIQVHETLSHIQAHSEHFHTLKQTYFSSYISIDDIY